MKLRSAPHARGENDERMIDRRAVLKATLATAALGLLPGSPPFAALVRTSVVTSTTSRSRAMKIMCMIRYQIDPFQRDAFKQYAETWGRAIPRAGGQLVGYFLPYEGTNDIAWGLIAFESLAAYEAYRAKLRTDAESVANFNFAQTKRFILREERTFVEVVEGTFGVGR